MFDTEMLQELFEVPYVSVKLCDCPTPRLAKVHCTTLPFWLQPAVLEPGMNVKPGGGSVTVMFVATFGPLFVIVTL
jgi:hypothetical protein